MEHRDMLYTFFSLRLMHITRFVLPAMACLMMMTACTNEDSAEAWQWPGADYPNPEREEGAKRIMLATDIHVMAKELLISGGEAYNNYKKRDPKLLEYSEEVLQTLVDRALETRPDLIIIPGDLTKDGELLSHQKVASLLAPLHDEGIPVVVVPGNHDIENPDGKYFNGSETSPAERTSPEMFTSIYRNYGYGSAIERDETSMSYVTEPLEGLVLLCIDSNRYDENLYKEKGDERDMNQTAGRIRQSTLDWLCEQADKAREKGKQVVVVQHHNMVPHHDAEPAIQSDYLIEDHKEVAEKLMAHGIHLALTGHLHLHDVAQLRTRHDGRIDSLVDIATSSAVSYPNAYRMITASNNFTKWRVETEYVTSTASIDDIQQKSKQMLQDNIFSGLEASVNEVWDWVDSYREMLEKYNLPPELLPDNANELTALLKKYIGDELVEAYLIHCEGNEGKNPRSAELQEELKNGTLKMLRQRLTDIGMTEKEADNKMLLLSIAYNMYLEPMLRGILSDINQADENELSSITDDLNPTLLLPH